MHHYKSDFYGSRIRVAVLGYIRPELNYISKGNGDLPFDMASKIYPKFDRSSY